MPERVEIIVVGAGPVGLTAAISLAASGAPATLIARRAPPDSRTTALLGGSVAALETLGVWQRCASAAAPLRTMRLSDDTNRLLRAPEARFEAAEIGLEAFGHNIENKHLVMALEARAAELPNLTRIEDDVTAVSCAPDAVTVTCASSRLIEARLAIGADGRRSLCRAAAGIETEGWNYPQIALTFNVTHERPHRDISTEFHTETGPFTLVPLPGLRSSIVCVVDAAQADRLDALGEQELGRELERRAHSILGKMTVEPGRGRFPLGAETARRFFAQRIVLAGEAAHRIPPIGAQGLNLGLRDAAMIGELAVEALAFGEDPGSDSLLARYDEARRADVTSRTYAVDVLNRTLLSSFLPFQGARGLGLYLMNRVGPLRRAVMREGVTPAAQPRLMRGEALS